MTILVVDDTPTNRKLLHATLEAEGFAIVEAEDGVDALAALEREDVDAIVSDILMPRMDGFRLCREVRKNPQFAHLPFVIYSSTFTSRHDEKVALDSGADRFLQKPCPAEQMAGLIKELVAAVRTHRLDRPAATGDLDVMKEYSEALVRKLEERNAELQRVTETLRASEERLAEANRLKDEFLATLSHELRAPLNAILGWTQMLLQRQLDPARSRHALEVIDRNARLQATLISDILDVSRIVSGKLRLNFRRLDLIESLQPVLDATRPTADAKRIQVVTNIGDDLLVLGDPERLQQVLWNLLSNAVKFTPEDGRVAVEATNSAGSVRICVSDTGVGLAPEALPHVFERFWQADGSPRRQYGGLGLGLAIVRHLVELHGGSVAVESDGPGCGATFTVALPALALSQAGAMGASGPAHTPLSRDDAHARPLTGIRAVVMDDEEDTRDVLHELLTGFGARVSLASCVKEGLAQVRESRPDVILADIGMPQEDGYDFIARLRRLARAQGGSTPTVALTAFGRAEDRARVLAAGFDEYLTKPVNSETLVAAISALVRGAGLSGG